MPARKIDHMNVVAHARAVGSRIIVAEDLDAFELARGNLRHIGKQVVRDALRVFADPAAFMRTDRVEVTQQHHIPLRIRTVQIGKDALEHGFGLAIRIGGLVLGTIFGDRNHLGVAIDGRAAREDDVLHIMVARYIEQYERTGNVVPIVFERLLGRFAHRFKACEVDDRIDVVRSEYLVERFAIEDIHLIERELFRLTRDLANATDSLFARVGKIVDHDHVIALLEQFNTGVTSDETRATGYEDRLICGRGC